jgi:hypothetical protein
MTQIQNPEHMPIKNLGHLSIGDWNLFVIWDL